VEVNGAVERTLCDERMNGDELWILGMVGIRAGDEVLEEEEVAGTALDDGQEPVAQLEPATAWV